MYTPVLSLSIVAETTSPGKICIVPLCVEALPVIVASTTFTPLTSIFKLLLCGSAASREPGVFVISSQLSLFGGTSVVVVEVDVEVLVVVDVLELVVVVVVGQLVGISTQLVHTPVEHTLTVDVPAGATTM